MDRARRTGQGRRDSSGQSLGDGVDLEIGAGSAVETGSGADIVEELRGRDVGFVGAGPDRWHAETHLDFCCSL